MHQTIFFLVNGEFHFIDAFKNQRIDEYIIFTCFNGTVLALLGGVSVNPFQNGGLSKLSVCLT